MLPARYFHILIPLRTHDQQMSMPVGATRHVQVADAALCPSRLSANIELMPPDYAIPNTPVHWRARAEVRRCWMLLAAHIMMPTITPREPRSTPRDYVLRYARVVMALVIVLCHFAMPVAEWSSLYADRRTPLCYDTRRCHICHALSMPPAHARLRQRFAADEMPLRPTRCLMRAASAAPSAAF